MDKVKGQNIGMEYGNLPGAKACDYFYIFRYEKPEKPCKEAGGSWLRAQ
jgi:hypothetical protein